MKGIILAGGTGSRLLPLTAAINKHLLPVYDKPMIYYPLTTLMLAGIRDIILISTPSALPQFETLLGDGKKWGISINYLAQGKPDGIAAGLKIAAAEIEGSPAALILGDNIFFGAGLGELISKAAGKNTGASIFTYTVANPQAFGIVNVDAKGKPLSLAEKPSAPSSQQAVTGLYLYASDVAQRINALKPSKRGELEITDLNQSYLNDGRLSVYPLSRGYAWLDGGGFTDLFKAGQFIRVMEERTGQKIGCPDEIAYRLGFIGDKELK
jgi:glucose-1-phosphate thymidylyltransferase